MPPSSRLPGFYKLTPNQRATLVGEATGLSAEDLATLEGGLRVPQADTMIENVVGVYGLPLGIATNLVVNGRDVLVPMAVEEPSVVAGLSYAARMVRAGGGFRADADEPVMIGQMQVLGLSDLAAARLRVLAAREELMAQADAVDPVIVGLGGGAREIQVRAFDESPVGPMLVVR